jgi:dephospho-CoA kinase
MKTLQVGITGGIGSGKSFICRIFKSLGAKVYDADSQAKKLMNTDTVLGEQIKKEFGTASYANDGMLDRDYLGREVFGSPEKVLKLNQLVHPRVALDYKQWADEQQQEKYIIKESALLYEAGSYGELDRIIVVSAPVELRIERVMKRDPRRTAHDVREIIRNQMSDEEKTSRADFVIINDGSELLLPQVIRLHEIFSTAV